MSSSGDRPNPDPSPRSGHARLTRAVRRRLRRHGISWIDGDDVVQEAWLRVLSGMHPGRRSTPDISRALLAVVARRIAIDASRRSRPNVHAAGAGPLEEPDAVRATPLERRERQQRLREALARLNTRQRALIFLRLWLAVPWELCARVLEFPSPHAAECAYHRAMKRLRRSWPPAGE